MGSQEGELIPKADGPQIVEGKDKPPPQDMSGNTVIVANLKQIVSDAEGPNSTKEEDPSSYKVTEPRPDLDNSDDDDMDPFCATRSLFGWKVLPYEDEGDKYPGRNVYIH